MDKDVQEFIRSKHKWSKTTQAAIDRFEKDLKSDKWIFDESAADKVIRFVEVLKQRKGRWAGKNLKLLPWQKFVIYNIYGFKDKKTGFRRFKKAYLQVARKNGKTTLMAPLAIHNALTEKGAEIYCAATQVKQAEIAYHEIKSMIMKDPNLQSLFEIYSNRIVYKDSVIMPLSSETDKQDGTSPSFALIDEYHQHSDDSVVTTLQYGQGNRDESLLFIITTAGTDKNSVCYQEYERAKKIVESIIEDDSYFSIIFELEESDKWTDQKNFYKANPSIGEILKEEDLVKEMKEALQKPSVESMFRTKRLNQWVQTNTKWIRDNDWIQCQKPFDEEKLVGQYCTGGMDLSKTSDFSALTWTFRLDDGRYYLKHYFFIPDEAIEEKISSDNVLVRKWIEQGYIIATPGRTINYDYIYDIIQKDKERYFISEIAYDRNLSNDLVAKLKDEEFVLRDFNQSMAYMSNPSKHFEQQVLDRNIIDNNPVMRWMVSCASVKTDHNENIKVIKDETGNAKAKRIDGVISSIMALDSYRLNGQDFSDVASITDLIDMY